MEGEAMIAMWVSLWLWIGIAGLMGCGAVQRLAFVHGDYGVVAATSSRKLGFDTF